MKEYRKFSGTLAALNHYAQEGWSLFHVESYKLEHVEHVVNHLTEAEYFANSHNLVRLNTKPFTLITGLLVRDADTK